MLIVNEWIQLPSIPLELWNPTSLKDHGNAIGTYVEAYFSYLQTQRRAVALILVSMDTRTELKEFLNLIRGNVTWQQPLEYEGLSFRCHRYHKVGHLARKCPIATSTVTTHKRRYPKDVDP